MDGPASFADRATVWLHIGHGKTGTTALQTYFVERDLQDSGIFYPKTGRMPLGGHHRLFPPRRQREMMRAAPALLAQVLEEIGRQAKGVVTILSSELLCYAREEQIAALAEVFGEVDLRILYYVRRQDALIDSSYRWQKEDRPDLLPDIETYVEQQHAAFDFMARLAPWRRHFDDAQFRLRLYDKKTCGNDIASDALSVMGLEPMDLPSARRIIRPTLDARLTAVLAAHDRLYGRTLRRKAFVDALHSVAETFPAKDAAGFLSPEKRAGIMRAYAESNRELARRFLTEKEAELLLAP